MEVEAYRLLDLRRPLQVPSPYESIYYLCRRRLDYKSKNVLARYVLVRGILEYKGSAHYVYGVNSFCFGGFIGA